MIPILPNGDFCRVSLIKFSKYVKATEEELRYNVSSIMFIDDFELLKANFDLFKKVIGFRNIEKVYAKDFACLKFIEENLEDYEGITLSLVDDFQNKDRSYMDLTQFQKTSIEVPLSYTLWNPTLQDNQAISLYYERNSLNPHYSNGYSRISTENLKKIRELIHRLSEKYKNFSSEEKIILISNYIQNVVQYVGSNNISQASSGKYITDSNGLVISDSLVGSPETVLLQHFGVCNAIANATTLLLNNPMMNVNVRSIYGCNHAWNVYISDENYYVDNTWCITRNKDRYPESLKARSFSSDYLFFGTDSAQQMGHHIPNSYCPKVNQEDMDKEQVEAMSRKLVRVANFSDYNPPVFESRFQR